jgi:hypothetical protein
LLRRYTALIVAGAIFLVFVLMPYLAKWPNGGLDYYGFGTLVAAMMVLGIMSFLLKENSFYRLLEHIMIGVAGGMGLFRWWYDQMRTRWWDVLWENVRGEHPVDANFFLAFLLPVFGILWYFTFSRKNVWLSRIIIGFFMGVAAGYTVREELGKQIGQLQAMAAPLFGGGHFPWETVTIVIMFVLVILCMYYFFFTFKREGPLQNRLAQGGRIAMMIGFGALFGNTVQGRLSWLIDRFIFLVDEVWVDVIKGQLLS